MNLTSEKWEVFDKLTWAPTLAEHADWRGGPLGGQFGGPATSRGRWRITFGHLAIRQIPTCKIFINLVMVLKVANMSPSNYPPALGWNLQDPQEKMWQSFPKMLSLHQVRQPPPSHSQPPWPLPRLSVKDYPAGTRPLNVGPIMNHSIRLCNQPPHPSWIPMIRCCRIRTTTQQFSISLLPRLERLPAMPSRDTKANFTTSSENLNYHRQCWKMGDHCRRVFRNNSCLDVHRLREKFLWTHSYPIRSDSLGLCPSNPGYGSDLLDSWEQWSEGDCLLGCEIFLPGLGDPRICFNSDLASCDLDCTFRIWTCDLSISCCLDRGMCEIWIRSRH